MILTKEKTKSVKSKVWNCIYSKVWNQVASLLGFEIRIQIEEVYDNTVSSFYQFRNIIKDKVTNYNVEYRHTLPAKARKVL